MSIELKLKCEKCAKMVALVEAKNWVFIRRWPSGQGIECARMEESSAKALTLREKDLIYEHICPACLPSLLLAQFVTPGADPYPMQLEHGTL